MASPYVKRLRGRSYFAFLIATLGGLLVLRAAWMLATLLLGRNPVAGAHLAIAWRGAAGFVLIVLGVVSLVSASTVANSRLERTTITESEFIAFETGIARSQNSNLPLAYGPPRPLILVRCRRCETLNEMTESYCARCGDLI